MSNVIQFTPRGKPQLAPVENIHIPVSVEKPTHGGYPTRSVQSSGPQHIGSIAKNISHTAAGQVVAALQFYALSGFDHGETAREALIGMRSVVESLPPQSA